MGSIGDFLCTEIVWIGSCSLLYKALEPTSHNVCLLKEVDYSDLDDSSVYFYLLRQEGPLLSAISHPNIVTPLMYCEDYEDKAMWLVFPFYTNGSLCDVIKRFKQCNSHPSESFVYAVVASVARALRYLHTEAVFSGYTGILHRNIISKSVLIANDGTVLLSGFDFACPLELMNDEKQCEVYGCKACAPPELGRSELSVHIDVWALGCLVYEICTGSLLFADSIRESGINSSTSPNSNTDFDFELSSPELTSLCKRMLVIDYTKRPTLDELLSNPLVASAPSTVLDLLPTTNTIVKVT